jgi:hypothetical protein
MQGGWRAGRIVFLECIVQGVYTELLKLTEVVMATSGSGTTKSKAGTGATKTRKVADCRLFPSEKNCSLTIAGTEEEVLEVAVQHAITSHGHPNTPELRNQIKAMLKDER